MKNKWLMLLLSLALIVGLGGVLPAPRALAAACTWTGTTSTAWETTTNWSGCAAAPANNDTVIIPNVTNDPIISTAATTGLNVTIQNGGLLTNSSSGAITFNNFTIENGGKYIHNKVAALPGTTRSFATDSTIEYQLNTSNTCPVSANYGNLIINISNFTSNVDCATNLSSIAGGFEIKNTSGFQLRLVSTQNTAHTIGGNLTLSGGTLVISSNTGSPSVSVGGDVTISSGTFDLVNSSGSPTLNIGGNFNQTGGTFTSSGTGIATVAFTGGSSSVTLTTSGGTFTNTNLNWQIASGKTVANNTNFGAGSWVASGRTMTVNGTFQINQGSWTGSSGAWSYGTDATLVFNNNSSDSYGVGNDVYWPTTNGPTNVTVQGAGGITMNVARTVGGAFQTAAGVRNGNSLTLNGTTQINTGGFFLTNSPTYGGSSTLVYNPGSSYNIGSEWISGGTVGSGVPKNVTIQNNTAVTLPNGAGSRTVNGNLLVNAGSTFDLGTNTIASVGGTVTNNGTLKQTQTVNANATVTFLNVSTSKYYGVEIAAGGTALGSTTVAVSGNQVCSQASGYPVKRCFGVTPTTQASANIKFYYSQVEMQNGQAYNTLNVWNYHTSTWNAVTRGGDSGACATNALNCYVQGNGIATYSPFALKVSSPQAVTLADFNAVQMGDAVLVTWETNSEINNRGFNLYRGVSPNEPDRQLNDALIPSQSPGGPGGYLYTWEDRVDLVSGTTYYYWVEDVDLNNVATRHGPVSVDYSAPTAVRLVDAGAATALPLALPALGAAVLALAGLAARRRRR